MRAINPEKRIILPRPLGMDAGPLFCLGSALTACARLPMKLN